MGHIGGKQLTMRLPPCHSAASRRGEVSGVAIGHLAATLVMLVLAASSPVYAEVSAPDEIVVIATRGKCTIVRAGAPLTGGKLDAFAKGWPQEQPMRIVEPRGADYQCLAKIAFQLQRKGIRSIEFVAPTASD